MNAGVFIPAGRLPRRHPIRAGSLPDARTQKGYIRNLITPLLALLCSFRLNTSALLLLIGTISAQAQRPSFSPPLDIPLNLSGNFMEPRTGHFHSGLDMRTEGREGLPVRAAAKGWVSRIKVSPWGYGHALYIDHPEGYTTVYGHLREFVGGIAKAALEAQYKARDFSIDATFSPGELPVQSGELVAFSGNTGGSGGPHLHFEVRLTGDQHALDPELFGLAAADDIPPQLNGIRIDPLDTAARVAPYPAGALGFAVDREGAVNKLRAAADPAGLGAVGISVNVIDRYSGSSSNCGVRSLQVEVDGSTVFRATLDEVDFGLQRYCDAYMDHALFKGKDLAYNRCYRLPNNKLRIYDPKAGDGRIELRPGDRKQVRITATDAHGNRSTLVFTLRGGAQQEAQAWPRKQVDGTWFAHDRENRLERPGMRFTLPAEALYADEPIAYEAVRRAAPGKVRLLSPMHRIHDPLVPLHTPGRLSLRVDSPPAGDLAGKLLLVRVDEAGKLSPVGGTWENGWVNAKVKTLGTYAVALDTVPPVLTPLDLKPVLTGRSSFSFRVADDLSGVEQWSATLDGEWILLAYDPKRKELKHTFDLHSDLPGEHKLVVEVRDERGNRTSKQYTFKR